MIAYLKGKIILKKERFVIVETGGVGYKVFVSSQTLLKLPEIGELVNLFVFHDVRENISDLYGFLKYEELEFFEILNDIRGVGPKAALEIASLGSLEKIKDKILNQDEKLFEGIPGIGKKKTMTIILELTGKIKALDKRKTIEDPAMSALINLGFSKEEVKKALKEVPSDIKNIEERVKIALKNLAKS